MRNIEISSYEDLVLRIMYLKDQKLEQEIELKRTFKDIVSQINPITIIKDSVLGIIKDKEIQYGLASIGINMGINFIVDKVFGKNKSVKGFWSSLLVETFTGTYVTENMPKIIAGISSLMHRKPEEEPAEEPNEEQ